jgi:2',3'-cyclic-nucleotide 2'-phosphodiesterase (5'-nucleotidase family)
MFRVFFISVIGGLLVCSCQKDFKISSVENKRLEIDGDIEASKEIDDFVKPYTRHVDSSLGAVLCYSAKTLSKKDGELNTALGNMMADAVYVQANPVFKQRFDREIDFVLLNHGGIRSVIVKGPVTARTAYEVMPFENEVVVVGLKGTTVKQLINYLQQSKRAHPVSRQLKISLDANYDLVQVLINDQAIEDNVIYYVATSDYLFNGGDKMSFFQDNVFHTELDYKIRNVLLDYFAEKDTLRPIADNRFKRILPES